MDSTHRGPLCTRCTFSVGLHVSRRHKAAMVPVGLLHLYLRDLFSCDPYSISYRWRQTPISWPLQTRPVANLQHSLLLVRSSLPAKPAWIVRAYYAPTTAARKAGGIDAEGIAVARWSCPAARYLRIGGNLQRQVKPAAFEEVLMLEPATNSSKLPEFRFRQNDPGIEAGDRPIASLAHHTALGKLATIQSGIRDKDITTLLPPPPVIKPLSISLSLSEITPIR